jgi:hypothetical protein
MTLKCVICRKPAHAFIAGLPVCDGSHAMYHVTKVIHFRTFACPQKTQGCAGDVLCREPFEECQTRIKSSRKWADVTCKHCLKRRLK